MILPTTVVTAAIERLLPYADEIAENHTTIEETGEDSSDKMTPPYIAVYADFDQEAELDGGSINVFNLPISVYATCHSSAHETAAESFNEAFIMAIKAAKLLVGEYVLTAYSGNQEWFLLQFQKLPMVIIRKSAEGSVIQVQFEYTINDLVA